MINKSLKMEQTPFHQIDKFKETKGKRKSVRTDIAPEDYKLIEDFINQREKDFNTSTFVRELLLDFFNNHAFEQKYFNNLIAVLLMPQSVDPDELNDKCQVIGLLHDQDYFFETGTFHGEVNHTHNFKFIFTLKEFNQENYRTFFFHFSAFNKLDENIFFNVDKSIQHDFDKVKARLSELYQDIDLDDAYFVAFPLNNYLDVLEDGVYRSKTSEFEHEGVIALLEDFNEGVFAHIEWNYLEDDFFLTIRFQDFSLIDHVLTFDCSNPDVIKEFHSISKTVSRQGKLEIKRKHALNQIEFLKEEIEKNERQIKEIDEELSQYDEENN